MALVLAGGLSAQGVFAPWHTAELRSVRSAVISPDGQTIAYLLSVPRRPIEEDSGPAWTEIHVVGESGQSRPYVTGKVSLSELHFTPDGKALSFLSKREGDEHRSLYSIALSGGEARRLVEHDSDLKAYSWSPDGAQVAFLSADAEDEETEKLKEKGFDQVIYEEDLSYTRVWIAPVGREGEPRKLELEGSVRSVRWSPAGDRIMVTVAPTPLIDQDYTSQGVTVVDLDGKVLSRIDNPGKLGAVEWSPDGNSLALISAADANDPAAGRLMVSPAKGGGLRDLLPSLEGHVSSFAWRDDDTVLFLADEGVTTWLGSIDLQASSHQVHIETGGPVLTSISLSGTGAAALVGESPRHPREVFSWQLGEVGVRRQSHSNPWLPELKLGEQEVVRYSARDGLDLHGMLIHPIDQEKKGRYPLILVVHGGPESHYRNGWLTSYSMPGQVAAGRGFAVFYPNYRGSTGRGVAFSKLSQADAAGKEFEDLIDAIDHLIARGLVDRDRVGITGASYGGYASAWGATYYSERFAAAIPFVGVSDNVSKVGTTDIAHEMHLVHHRKWLWEDWSYFLERSPIYHVEKNRTPTLILHGKDDPRVHPGQSLELYRHLKVLDQAPVRLVLYPGEGHGNRKSAARFDYHVRTLRWMDYYLKGPGGALPPYEIDYSVELPYIDSETE